ncbi:MAG: amidase [Alphaproteobacteria bacterium]|nr:amidase [Alphaproteobacteria bacterium]MDE2073788.1 amidase [Alphaproteobacteria bacterium]
MNLGDYVKFDGLGLAELVRTGQVSARELAETALRAVELVNPRVQAVVETYADVLPGLERSPPAQGLFQGVPFLVKDLVLHEEGRLTESGSRLAAGLRSPNDTDLARRFHAAGLVTLGRTKTPELGFNITTENIFHGPVHSPWNLERSPGGSSGGSAAAVASGMVPLAHANDGGGSIRIPASCSGLFGLKPTRGRTPIGPESAEGLNGLGIEHVLSRSVRDSAAALDATQGAAPGDPYVIPLPSRPYLSEVVIEPAKLRIAVSTHRHALSKDCAKALDDSANLCAELGHHVTEAQPELGVSWDAFLLANARVWCSNMALWVSGLAQLTGRTPGPDTLEATTLACYEFGLKLSAVELQQAFDIFNTVSRTVAPFFASHDLLLTPTMTEPPALLGAMNANAPGLDGLAWTEAIFNASPFTPLFNVTGQPAASIPLALSAEGLPIGMQFAARFGDEATLFQLAGQLERAKPWAPLRPPVFAA